MILNKDTLEKITELRHALHRCAELSMQEKETIHTLQAFLRRHTSLEIHSREGWFYALKRGAKTDDGGLDEQEVHEDGPGSDRNGTNSCRPAPIAFRADMDALPIPETISLPYGSLHDGISHKCGHDGHCAALCGLALELDRIETMRDIYLIFQPGEEIGAGAVLCRDLLREKGIGEIYAFHNLGGYPEGALVYRPGLTQPASEGLRIHLTGKTSHASAPEKGLNPAEVLAKIVLFAQGLAGESAMSATEDPEYGIPQGAGKSAIRSKTCCREEEMRLCTITGIRLGENDFGISPGEGEVCMTLRAAREEDMKEMERSILARAAELAGGAGLQLKSSIQDYFPETRNHERCLRRVLDAAQRRRIPAVSMPELWRASEDFGHYLKECPGAMVYIGTGELRAPLHTVEYDFNDRILGTAVSLFLELARG